MPEPTSTLTFQDLILEVARFIGVADYGASGTGEVAVPTDPHDLNECKRHVNNAIRMFIADAPRAGWRWLRPIGSFTIWGDIGFDSTNTLTSVGYDPINDETTLTVSTAAFYDTMELRTLIVSDDGLTDDESYTINAVDSSTQIRVAGDATGADGDQWRIASTGDFTLPPTFSGEHTGAITYEGDSNQGLTLQWVSESLIRRYREDITDESGDPIFAAVRVMAVGAPRRRWELMMYPEPDDTLIVEFPFTVHFDKLVDLNEVHPAPFSHDEAIRAACLAVAERDVEGVTGIQTEHYRRALQNSHRIDASSGPRRIGYFGNPVHPSRGQVLQNFRGQLYQRPDVTFTS